MSIKINSAKLKELAVEIISLSLILLFIYAALSKALEFQNFQTQLGQSPLLSAFTGFISYSLLVVEFTIAILLAVPKTRFVGLLASFMLMILFTAYIIVILNYSSYVPCSCGGILEKMTWYEHLAFNIGFTLMAAIAVLLLSANKKQAISILPIITCSSTFIIIALFLASENAMHHENPFIRRFIQGSAFKVGETSLNSNSQYIAGTDGNTVYLGDNLAPLHITAYDSTLKIKNKYKIQLEREDFPFSSVQVRVSPPYFYLMDGTVPVIYKGNTANWKAKLLMHSNNYYFSKAEIIAPDKIAFRAQELKSRNNILGTFNFSDSLQVQYAPNLLQKQIDGFFDTDGMMQYDSHTQKFIYAYYYRNQFIVANKDLQLNYRGKTIDTTAHANLKVAFIKETGQRKLASIPSTVNQLIAISGNLLFVNSKIMGRYESKKMWKQASIIDIYDINQKTYLFSFYIYNSKKAKIHSMLISENNLYAIIGHQIHKYRLNKKFFKAPTNN
ncbi:MauE/DoxX family redox-associated membrane protein [Flavobacterium sp. WC2509]|uniref:MauE/DoxX family redox-associated membrane protein n=1 Tax=Flavobacterium sp. WC2509 TaxID=3461406 RepID=UPI004044DFD1